MDHLDRLKPGDEIGGEKVILTLAYRDEEDDLNRLFITNRKEPKDGFHIFSHTTAEPLHQLKCYHSNLNSAIDRLADIVRISCNTNY